MVDCDLIAGTRCADGVESGSVGAQLHGLKQRLFCVELGTGQIEPAEGLLASTLLEGHHNSLHFVALKQAVFEA